MHENYKAISVYGRKYFHSRFAMKKGKTKWRDSLNDTRFLYIFQFFSLYGFNTVGCTLVLVCCLLSLHFSYAVNI